MKFSIVLTLILSTSLWAVNNQTVTREQSSENVINSEGSSEDEHEGGCKTPKKRIINTGRSGHIQITPGSNFRRRVLGQDEDVGLRLIISFANLNTLGDQTHAVYLITTGNANLAELPILDLGDQFLTDTQIERLLAEMVRILKEQSFYRYVGITTRSVDMRVQEHARATAANPQRRLPLAILNENTQGNPAYMHVLLRGVHPDQLIRLEALLIRALQGTGQLGLNGNTGHLGELERGIRGQVEITPSTATPGQVGGRSVFQFNMTQGRLQPLPTEQMPVAWQNIIYLITPPEVQIQAPIIDLNDQRISEEQMLYLEQTILARLVGDSNFERYVGLSIRTPQERASEHEQAGLTHPYRRLPYAINRVNQESGPVQMHVLLTGVHLDQIEWIENRLIRLLGGTSSRGWNSNPGYQDKIGNKRKKPDDDGDGPGPRRLFFNEAVSF